MKHVRLAALAVLVVGFGASVAEGAGLTQAKIALHLTTPPAKNTTSTICNVVSPDTLRVPCSNYVVSGAINTSYLMYLVVAGIPTLNDTLSSGVTGITLGIKYTGGLNGIHISQWTTCSDLEFPNGTPQWPESGGGNIITWTECHGTVIPPDGVHRMVGAFSVYAYGADTFQITTNNNIGVPALQVANCAGAQIDVDPLAAGFVKFGGAPGCDPCLPPNSCPVPVAPTTWGKIKNLYH